MSNLQKLIWPGSAAFVVIMVTFVLSQGSGTPAQSAPIVVDDVIFPRVKIIALREDGIGRFDTATGEIWRYSGEISGAAAQGTWIRIARKVTQSHSGLLDLRRIRGGTFLVDLNTGETWVLRRETGLGNWRRINILGA